MTTPASSPPPTLDHLHPHHLSMLREGSAITDEVITARRYRTVTTRAELRRLGFSDSQARVLALLIPIWGTHGQIILYQMRPDEPRIVKGKPVKYETPSGSQMRLDVPPTVRHLLPDPNVPLFVTEGVKKGDSLASQGCCAVALLGVWNWRGTNEVGGKTALADWEQVALNGRQVYIVFDSDVMTKVEVHNALVRLKAFLESRGASVALIYLPAGQGASKVGVDDFLASGHTLDELLALATPHLRETPASAVQDSLGPDDDRSLSQATQLVEIGSRVALFHDPQGDAFAVVTVSGHRETWAVRSTTFRRWLAREFYQAQSKAPSGSALADAITVIEGKAQFEGETRPVWTRVADGPDGSIYVDLGSPTWEAIRVTPSDWAIVPDPPVHFRRGPASTALPEPVRGGSVDELRSVVNVASDADFLRVVAWLVGALRPRGPYPVLAFIAEQGSGKSVTARFIRSLVDPSAVSLRGMPKEERDLVIAARANHVLALDNVSHLAPWLSDALCRLATGAGWATRRLYTDADEEVFVQSRPALMTGIEEYVGNADLLDRAMLLGLPAIPEECRQQEADLEAAFQALRPRVFGALLDAVAAALRNLPQVRLPTLPRMADFAAWVMAAAEALPWSAEEFLQAYMEGAEASHDVVFEASPIAEPVRDLADRSGEKGWQGTASELLKVLAGGVEEDVRRQRGWPGTPRALSGMLRRLAADLRAVGVVVTFEREQRARRRRLITIRRKQAQPTVHTVQMVQPEPQEMDDMDAHGSLVDGLSAATSGVSIAKVDGVDGVDADSPTTPSEHEQNEKVLVTAEGDEDEVEVSERW